jgi:hypothetical protein
MIKGNFKIKKIEQDEKDLEERKFEELIEKSGAGSHMVFRSKDKDDEFFVDEI